MVGVTGAYYNEFDPKAVAWLRELIKRGLIAPGEVDERSISDVSPDDLIGFTQHHWFAGIGGWSLALRLAGWPDDRPVWTGSCPCQPFSSAGKGGGFADERHLWPHWEWLIGQHRPTTVFGEQVASKDGLEWFDLVSSDLEGQGYAVGSSDMCAAGFGAPHIRQRLWWVGLADAASSRHQPRARDSGICRSNDGASKPTVECGATRAPSRVADADRGVTGQGRRTGSAAIEGLQRGTVTDGCGLSGRVADAMCVRQQGSGFVGRSSNSATETDREVYRVVDAGWGSGMEHGAGDGRQQWRAEPSEWGITSGRGDGGTGDSERGVSGRRPGETPCAQNGGGCVEEPGDHGPVDASTGIFADRPTNAPDSPWRDTDWLYCRDGKWRPVESGTFPLAHGVSDRVVRLRGYGNAIVPQVAAEWIRAVMEC